MIQVARQNAVKLVHDGETEIEKKMTDRITQAQKTLSTEKDRIIEEKSKDTDQIKAYAELNFEKAVPIVLEIFERSINAETPEDE
jgi:vacuolar-type H+-ATPase subunit H